MTQRPASLDALAALFTDAAAQQRALRLVGRGTWLAGGAPVSPNAEAVHLDAFSGIVEYEPGDLTITVGAATTIAELDAVTAANNQWCPLAPWGGDAGSVGATIATATAGPFAHALGLPRDLVLGLECVDGTGKVLRPGGKVVKNVAGFDLVRLLTGSWGSLGAITRVSLRLRARPAVDETWAVTTDENDPDFVSKLSALCLGSTAPVACEWINARMAAHLGLAAQPHVLVRLCGSRGFVDAARVVVCALGNATEQSKELWTRLRTADAGAESTHRLTGRNADFWKFVVLVDNGTFPLRTHLSWMRQTARLIVPPGCDFNIVGIEGTPVAWVIETQGGGARNAAPAVAALNARVKAAFDPSSILNPGIMG